MTSEFFHRPPECDPPFKGKYDHPESEDACVKCDNTYLIDRDLRPSNELQVHYGLIASGNQVMNRADQLPCLVIRGICDYSDSIKNKLSPVARLVGSL
jgi:nucleoside phosphorylase